MITRLEYLFGHLTVTWKKFFILVTKWSDLFLELATLKPWTVRYFEIHFHLYKRSRFRIRIGSTLICSICRNLKYSIHSKLYRLELISFHSSSLQKLRWSYWVSISFYNIVFICSVLNYIEYNGHLFIKKNTSSCI